MKKRIGSLKGKPIIEGDINSKNASEIHISELNGCSGSGSGNELKWEYYRIDYEKVPPGNDLAVIITAYSELVNVADSDNVRIIQAPDMYYDKVKYSKIAGTNKPIYYNEEELGESVINNNSFIENIKEWLAIDDIPYLIPITKEEFFTFDNINDYFPPFKQSNPT